MLRPLRIVASCAVASTSIATAQLGHWAHPDGTTHWYAVVAVPGGATWDQAHRIAASDGGYLATITSSEENEFVFELSDRPEFWDRDAVSGEWRGPWLGGVQWPGSAEPSSGWAWGEPETFAFSAWTQGQPDNDGGADRVAFGGSTAGRVSTWADRRRDARRASFVIEFSGPGALKTVGLIDSNGPTLDGYTLFNPLRSGTTFLIDERGRAVRSWQSRYTPGAVAYLLPTGNLIRSGNLANPNFAVGGTGGIVEEFNWRGDVVWEFRYSSTRFCLHHDLEVLPNGNLLMIAWERKTALEAIAAGRDPELMPEGEVWPDKIIEVDRNGHIVWEWCAWDHLVQDLDPGSENYGRVEDHPELIDVNYAINGGEADWMHSNAVAYNAKLDQVMLSVRSFDELWIIDHSTTTAEAATHRGGRSGKGGDLLYRWGNPAAYRAGTAADQRLFKQHDTQWIPEGLPGAGNILVFNNGTDRPGGDASSVDEIVPPQIERRTGNYRRTGDAWGPDQPAWTFQTSPPTLFYSRFVSGAQRLKSGNTLVCGGWIGTILEVTPQNEIVWVYVNPWTGPGGVQQGDPVNGNQVFRSPHYSPDFEGFAGKTLVPGDPIETYDSILLADGSAEPREVRPGGQVSLSLRVAGRAGQFYLVGTSLTPGLTPIDFRFMRSGWDAIFTASYTNGAPSIFMNYTGTLDASGRATASLALPDLNGLVGLDLYTTFLVLDPQARSTVGFISNTVTVTVVN